MPQLIVTLILAAGLPLAWLVSEFQPRRWLRILLGSLALTLMLLMSFAFSLLERFNYNVWYGTASANLIDSTIAEIEAGHAEQLAENLRRLRKEFYPNYENRAHYDTLVEQFAKQTKTMRPDGE